MGESNLTQHIWGLGSLKSKADHKAKSDGMRVDMTRGVMLIPVRCWSASSGVWNTPPTFTGGPFQPDRPCRPAPSPNPSPRPDFDPIMTRFWPQRGFWVRIGVHIKSKKNLWSSLPFLINGRKTTKNARTRQIVHKMCSHFWCPLTPHLPNNKVMDFLLNLYQKNLKQNCEHSTQIEHKLSQNCKQTKLPSAPYELHFKFLWEFARNGIQF